MRGEAFSAFVDEAMPRLLGIAYGLTGNPHDAWDLVQETLVRVGLRWRRLADQNPGAYAQTVLIRLNVDRHRRRSREIPRSELPDDERLVRVQEGFDPQLLDALRTLSSQQRQAVVLRTIGDLDHAEIAARLGCSPTTARTHLRRGLERLRLELGLDRTRDG